MCDLTRRALLTTGAAAVVGGTTLGGTALGGTAAAAAPGRARTVAARRLFFGRANVAADGRVRPDRVLLSWFGVTSFAMAIGGRVVLLDAWVPRGTYARRVPVTTGDLVALRPSHVLLGHGHFDHAADAAPVAAATGAVVVGTPEHCSQVTAQAAAAGLGPVRTRPLAVPDVGDEAELRLGRRVRVTALRHVHSAVEAPAGDVPPFLPPPDPTPVLTDPPSLEDGLHTLLHQGDQEGGSLLYRFELGGFSLTWNDTAGPLRDDPSRVLDRLARRPRSDVHVGAVQGFGQYTNGLRDPLDYAEAVRSRVFVPSHHDNWLPPITAPASAYEQALREGLAAIPEARRPALRFVRDTRDYLDARRLTFRP
ncbi:MBL fold metallo-hydrolase [Nocardioides sp. SOB77]|uniref:MBL fold metallo-hydrolase n=1 Tax=Nocardioides oceani TaxID=3058369 RepID=A0ABT8FF20_9ACTN|nr:MBL fold metallo-hydrolase [Nocardioides oceani]MDN4173271.1 MBL fold metallo-hydrolase [Nocardioides oceani]